MVKSVLKLCLVSVLCFGMAACDIPQSFTVKGSPGLYLPLGSPLEKNALVKDFLTLENLKKQLGDNPTEVYHYRYAQIDTKFGDVNGIRDVQTFLVHYPIADLDDILNLNQPDISVKIPIPQLVSQMSDEFFPYEVPVSIPLDKMKKWVETIDINDGEEDKFSVIILQDAAILQDSLELKVEKLGISDFKRGTVSGNDLVFTADTNVDDFRPEEEGTLKGTAKLIKKPDRTGDLTVKVSLEWREAVVYPPNQGRYEDKIAGLSLYKLRETLGGMWFKDIPAYLFVDNLPKNTTARLSWNDGGGDQEIITVNEVNSVLFPAPASDVFTGSLNASFERFSLRDPFNSSRELTIKYGIDLPDRVRVARGDDESVKVDLVLVLPLTFDVSREDTETLNIGGEKYLKLDFAEIPEIENDLFDRKSDDDPMLIDGVKLSAVTLLLGDVKNNITEDIFLMVKNRGKNQKLGLKKGEKVNFSGDDLKYPFKPEFAVLVAAPPGDDSPGIFTIKPLTNNLEFDFPLILEGRSDFEITGDF
jgi:hypothetical protein